jgi:hypothetical protein
VRADGIPCGKGKAPRDQGTLPHEALSEFIPSEAATNKTRLWQRSFPRDAPSRSRNPEQERAPRGGNKRCYIGASHSSERRTPGRWQRNPDAICGVGVFLYCQRSTRMEKGPAPVAEVQQQRSQPPNREEGPRTPLNENKDPGARAPGSVAGTFS